MRQLILALAAGALTLMWSAQTFAGPPSRPPWSTIPKGIAIVGSRGGAPDSTYGQFEIWLTWFGQPTFDNDINIFINSSDIRLASAQPGGPYDINCAHKVIFLGTRGPSLGEAQCTLVGGGTGTHTPGPSTADITVDGVPFGNVPVAVYDLDGKGGLGASDLSLWLEDYGSGQYRARSDYDFDGKLSANDLSKWLSAFGAGGSSESASPLCP